jgi:two-component system LytT family response regulator
VTVFLTAFDQFAVDAFEAQALDYLVKPVSEARFGATMKRVARQLTAVQAGRSDPRIVVTTARGATVVHAHEIEWIEAADNYARIWTGGKSYLLRESLRDLERRVRPLGFVRAHRQALIPIDGVRELRRVGGGDLVAVLASGTEVPISRRRRAAIAAAVRGHRTG